MIKISVIMTSYNYAHFIKEAIDSVLNQTYFDFELIVVDDGSSDNSVEIIKNYCDKDERIKLFQHNGERNLGLRKSVILGVEKSQGDYIAFLESDDIWEKNNLEEKIKIIEKFPEAKIIFNDVELFGDEEVISDYDKYFKMNRKILSNKNFPTNLFSAFSFQNLIPTFSCIMVEKNEMKKADFNTTVEGFLDHWIWAHLAYENKIYYINKKLTLWRMHKRSFVEQRQKQNEKNFLSDIYKSLILKGHRKNMFFWKRHKYPKIEKFFRGFWRKFA